MHRPAPSPTLFPSGNRLNRYQSRYRDHYRDHCRDHCRDHYRNRYQNHYQNRHQSRHQSCRLQGRTVPFLLLAARDPALQLAAPLARHCVAPAHFPALDSLLALRSGLVVRRGVGLVRLLGPVRLLGLLLYIVRLTCPFRFSVICVRCRLPPPSKNL